MVILKEQAVEIKKQILAQVENSQMENKAEIKKSIKEMDEVELEGFLKANNIPVSGVDGSSDEGSSGGQCVFCSITKGDVPSYKLEETDKARVILELNPVSEGHALVLPKEHVAVDKLSKSIMTLSQKVAKRIKKKLKANDIKIETSNFQGHSMINIIPIYEGRKMEKKKAEEKVLEKLQKKLEIKRRVSRGKKVKVEKIDEKKIDNLPKVSFRIP